MCCQLPLIAPIIHLCYGIFAAHAIIVEDVTNEEVLVIDPAEGRKKITLEKIKRIWDFCNNLAIVIDRN